MSSSFVCVWCFTSCSDCSPLDILFGVNSYIDFFLFNFAGNQCWSCWNGKEIGIEGRFAGKYQLILQKSQLVNALSLSLSLSLSYSVISSSEVRKSFCFLFEGYVLEECFCIYICRVIQFPTQTRLPSKKLTFNDNLRICMKTAVPSLREGPVFIILFTKDNYMNITWEGFKGRIWICTRVFWERLICR